MCSCAASRYTICCLVLWTFQAVVNLSSIGSFPCDRSEDESDEMGDEEISKLVIVTQTPPAFRKHPGGDRTGNFTSRAKMTRAQAEAINDGLYYYEQVRWPHISSLALHTPLVFPGELSSSCFQAFVHSFVVHRICNMQSCPVIEG